MEHLEIFFLPDWVEEIQTLPVLGIVKSSPVEEGPHMLSVCLDLTSTGLGSNRHREESKGWQNALPSQGAP